ncbi:MAG: glutamyl-tRNA reductase [Hydrogenophaga sp.]|uniref:glutamyl-tRNA reductase n=1 Tax=Hydrogenophaga sp. TaxID=1904254 RepID=UPI00168DA225|nr:glutamyl-tRNA reductase [Hydrogenophaga sp.]NIM42524.1 glutamyl-tRNA reductase [Hydrogenophaga sp.]NIN27675.1 glutamyl-tRNA reductase [Hydrogenophaga sp.]NIN32495.1 glutamyl-tRNA reductase [Hydrogenophaga sp.]NIN56946.1 glutamyl-tRNA reductase [Hydrogenophaga sp.]NIO53091.1 glutamyl-tRNA reductase [Hydrogenophaga sp.]
MSVWTLGINHQTAPLDLRGRFAFALDQIQPTLHTLRSALPRQPEATLLSTCNRTELYGAGDPAVLDPTLDWLAQAGGVSSQVLRDHAYVLRDDQSARHAFRVASGLDSMVLGEAQILGQMKDAVRAADEAGALGTTLHQLFQRSFAVAKQVRSSTEIGAHSISMTAAAVRLASQLFEDLREVRVLFVGAGEMIELAATHFAAKTPRAMAIANRSMERGEKLASRFGAQVMRLAELPEQLHEFDVVVSCTASTLPLIGLGAVERALKKRKHRPMFMVDLAVPRDIEAEVKALDDVYLYTVDDLATVVQTGKDNRLAAVAQAEAIIDAGVLSFMHWMERRDPANGVVPLIQQINAQADAWRAHELNRARRLLARGEPVEAVLEALSKGLTQKMLHGTLAELHSGDAAARAATAETVSRLFLRDGRLPQDPQS